MGGGEDEFKERGSDWGFICDLDNPLAFLRKKNRTTPPRGPDNITYQGLSPELIAARGPLTPSDATLQYQPSDHRHQISRPVDLFQRRTSSPPDRLQLSLVDRCKERRDPVLIIAGQHVSGRTHSGKMFLGERASGRHDPTETLAPFVSLPPKIFAPARLTHSLAPPSSPRIRTKCNQAPFLRGTALH
ncbi:hypothetical protein NDU88_006167 [Pleurodeles waltl]|uniref:Uncharacterized protein n=1 Tax=Pleurodeles waltl TaxID=8319 RepID=A0AAV7UP78_PLEWA|nr:hypothetical protein NDU88_006167 [Pleurodeles waltl]